MTEDLNKGEKVIYANMCGLKLRLKNLRTRIRDLKLEEQSLKDELEELGETWFALGFSKEDFDLMYQAEHKESGTVLARGKDD